MKNDTSTPSNAPIYRLVHHLTECFKDSAEVSSVDQCREIADALSEREATASFTDDQVEVSRRIAGHQMVNSYIQNEYETAQPDWERREKVKTWEEIRATI